ncbi:GNAT family N-acetyltransferase [Phytoactinopolyspora alkaliphila]|uniref:GNAT family N-acetyltransferase n=1 Tax=Phytoactinopolyspora alkaliphila TaxID=1783498 RepID=A0A6N9YSY8_9ACTN|nr:GNAT family N-acetyltransferase [Phytoactinopolyspora alkaliphila]NED98075.1 GNAT family N-acetyltransferase [Phytoactinopolyspora alkaliphila]
MRHHVSSAERDRLLGRRVVVRRRLHGEAHAATDVLGVLEAWEAGELRVRRSSGADGAVAEVPEADVIAIKAIPARPVTRREIRDLEAAAAQGWQALDTAQLGGWLLRAARGFTRRANSCMPLDDPGRPLGEAIEAVEDWYRARELHPTFQVPSLLGGVVDDALDARGWSRDDDVLVLTALVGDVRRGVRSDLPAVRVDPHPDDDWLANYHYRGAPLPAHAVHVLTNADGAGFASVDLDGVRVAIARGAVSTAPSGRRWVGVTAVEVAPEARRRGLGSHVVAGLTGWAAGLGAEAAYLQVEERNTGAQAAYRKLGFGDHHSYHYRQAPG